MLFIVIQKFDASLVDILSNTYTEKYKWKSVTLNVLPKAFKEQN